jgi:hypothetical protein
LPKCFAFISCFEFVYRHKKICPLIALVNNAKSSLPPTNRFEFISSYSSYSGQGANNKYGSTLTTTKTTTTTTTKTTTTTTTKAFNRLEKSTLSLFISNDAYLSNKLGSYTTGVEEKINSINEYKYTTPASTSTMRGEYRYTSSTALSTDQSNQAKQQQHQHANIIAFVSSSSSRSSSSSSSTTARLPVYDKQTTSVAEQSSSTTSVMQTNKTRIEFAPNYSQLLLSSTTPSLSNNLKSERLGEPELRRPCIDFNPCKHGKCAENNETKEFMCQCDLGYMGPFCDLMRHPCDFKPCENGICEIVGDLYYKCLCKPNYTGVNCHIG